MRIAFKNVFPLQSLVLSFWDCIAIDARISRHVLRSITDDAASSDHSRDAGGTCEAQHPNRGDLIGKSMRGISDPIGRIVPPEQRGILIGLEKNVTELESDQRLMKTTVHSDGNEADVWMLVRAIQNRFRIDSDGWPLFSDGIVPPSTYCFARNDQFWLRLGADDTREQLRRGLTRREGLLRPNKVTPMMGQEFQHVSSDFDQVAAAWIGAHTQ
jgi:hypothetical protein